MKTLTIAGIVFASLLAGVAIQPLVKSGYENVKEISNPNLECKVDGYRIDLYPVRYNVRISKSKIESINLGSIFDGMEVISKPTKAKNYSRFDVKSVGKMDNLLNVECSLPGKITDGL